MPLFIVCEFHNVGAHDTAAASTNLKAEKAHKR